MSELGELALLSDLGAAGTLFALLLVGHSLGDFVFQTSRMVRGKSETKWLLIHSVEVTLLQGVVLLPLMSGPVAIGLIAIFVSHTLIDWLKNSTDGVGIDRVSHFCLDQLLHLLVLAGVWRALVDRGEVLGRIGDWGPLATSAAVVVTAIAFNSNGVVAILGALGLNSAVDEDAQGEARLVGILERMVMLGVLLIGQWLAFAVVVGFRLIGGRGKSDNDNALIATLVGAVVTLTTVAVVGVLI